MSPRTVDQRWFALDTNEKWKKGEKESERKNENNLDDRK
jgi:hypothetical protein